MVWAAAGLTHLYFPQDHVEKSPRTLWGGDGRCVAGNLPLLSSVHGLCGGPAVHACLGLQHPDSGHQVRGEGAECGLLGLVGEVGRGSRADGASDALSLGGKGL